MVSIVRPPIVSSPERESVPPTEKVTSVIDPPDVTTSSATAAIVVGAPPKGSALLKLYEVPETKVPAGTAVVKVALIRPSISTIYSIGFVRSKLNTVKLSSILYPSPS